MSYAQPVGYMGLGASDAALAAQAQIPEAILKAIRAIESGGHPRAVRFEPHLFHRFTDDRYRDQVPYTPARGSVSLTPTETNRAAFERAYRLDPSAAVRSTSWGRYQVLGGVGIREYGSPQAFVRAFNQNPSDVSDKLLVGWFKGRPPAQQAAQECRISDLAYLYNGSRTSPWRTRLQAALDTMGGCTPGIATARRVGPYVGAAVLVAAAGFAGWAYYKYGR